MRYTPSRTLLASAIASIILAGCGGGSGGSSKNSSSASSSNNSVSTNVAPKFNSATSVSREEGISKATGYVAIATDSDNNALTYSVSGGADKAQFIIDAASGVLSFITAPDFEQPIDANLDNVYEVEVTVADGKGGKASQLVQVTVKNVEPSLTALSKSSDTELIPGNTVTGQSSCDGCDPALTKYEWYVEGTDTAVSTTASYKIKSEDRFKKITLKATPYTTSGEAGNTETVVMLRNQVKDFFFLPNGFVALKTDGTILVESAGKVITSSDINLFNVKSIYRDDLYGFAALKEDGSLVVLQDLRSEGEVISYEIPNIDKVYDGAALSKDNKLYAWHHGVGIYESSPPLTNIVDVAFGEWGTIAAVKSNGSVITLTHDDCGLATEGPALTNIVKVSISHCTIAGISKEGDVKVWGGYRTSDATLDIAGLNLTNVVDVVSSDNAFAAIKSDGSVVTWGYPDNGGDSGGKILNNVSRIFFNDYAFAAIKTDGSVVSWGDDKRGGDSDGKNLANVVDIVPSAYGFAAIKADGSVTAWGSSDYWVMKDYTGELRDVTQLLSGGVAFVALQKDGTVTSLPSYPNWEGWSKSSKADFKDVVKLFGDGNHAALKNNGEVFSWGSFQYGGNVDDVDLTPYDIISSSTIDSSASSISSSSISSSSSTMGSSASSISSSNINSSSSSTMTSSSISSVLSSSSNSFSSTSSSLTSGEQCSWFGTIYPLCKNTTDGWGYENNKSCVSRSTCESQPAPYGVIGGSTSSSVASNSSSSTNL